jgi:hypothetical protein
MNENRRGADDQLRQKKVEALKGKALLDIKNLRKTLGKDNGTKNEDPFKGAAENLCFIYEKLMPLVTDYLLHVGSISLVGKGRQVLDGGIYVRFDGLHIVPNTEELCSWKLSPGSLQHMYEDPSTKKTIESLGRTSRMEILRRFQFKVKNPEGSFF